MAFNISESLLERVRTAATRAKSHVYDDEIKTTDMPSITISKNDLDRLNILFDEDDLEDEIVVAVITYVKSKFGTTDASYKESMAKTYEDLRQILMTDKSHKKVR